MSKAQRNYGQKYSRALHRVDALGDSFARVMLAKPTDVPKELTPKEYAARKVRNRAQRQARKANRK